MDYNQIYGNDEIRKSGEKKEDLNRKVYWVIISKNKHADKFYIGPYLCVYAHTLIIVSDGKCHCKCGRFFDLINNPVDLDKCYHFPTKKVEDIVIGDNVLSYNEKTGKKEWDKVIDTSNMFSDEIMTINFSNGNRLKCTPNHPIYIHDKGWVKSEDLVIGDRAIQLNYSGLSNRLKHLVSHGWSKGLTRDNDERINTEIITVTSIERTRKNTRVYDISTEKNHNFFAYGVLVHNTKEGAMNRKMNSSGYVVVYTTTERDAAKVRVEFEQLHEME